MRLVRRIAFHTSSGISSVATSFSIPALLTRTSMPPKRSTTAATIATTWVSSPTSAWRLKARSSPAALLTSAHTASASARSLSE